MNRLLILCAATALVLPVAACNQTSSPAAPASTHDADVKAIQDNETQWVADWASKDAAKIAAHYTDDAVLMTPGSEAVSGKDAITKSLAGMVSDPAFLLQFHADHVDTSSAGDMGYSQGSYTITLTDQSKKVIHDKGNYVTVYRKQADGGWKAVSDIASSNAPPAEPAPAKGIKPMKGM